MSGLLVVIGDLDAVRVSTLPGEAYTVLVVNPNAMLPHPIGHERFERIAG